jgi:hypothetical protein
MFVPPFASRVRNRERRKFIARARGAERAITTTRAQGLRTRAAEKKIPQKTQDARLRTPLQASSTPIVVPASWMTFPDRPAATPKRCRIPEEWAR